ncbi:MAG: M24 family metallopeptidase [Candidatus Bathycorpusculaceae bacterium]
MKRIESLKQIAFEKKGFDGFLIFNWANLLYLAGFPGATCLLTTRDDRSHVYVHSVNYEQARAEGGKLIIELVKQGENLMTKIAKQIKASGIKKLAVDTLSFEEYRDLAREIRGVTKLKLQSNLVWRLRKVKDEVERELMRKAGELTSEGMRVAYETLKVGAKENEVAAEIEYAMRRKGSYGTAFETIVASGARSAFPHGGCTDKEIREGDLVVVDIGAVYQFYRSDMTRTLVAGKPSEKQKRLYGIVKQAQEKAFHEIKPKAKAKDVDATARKVIEDAGYGEYFVHGLGHGIGLEVHEPPSLGPTSKDRLEVGNIVTNEPGIYLVGFGGIRIEDSVLLEEHLTEKLTHGPYSLEVEK